MLVCFIRNSPISEAIEILCKVRKQYSTKSTEYREALVQYQYIANMYKWRNE